MDETQRKRLKEATRAWRAAEEKVEALKEDLRLAEESVERAHYDFEQWESESRYKALMDKLESAQEDLARAGKDLRDACEAAGLVKP